MPSRKKDRGRQRKAAKQKEFPRAQQGVEIRGLENPSPYAASVIRELKQYGCRITKGSSTIRHPCFGHIDQSKTTLGDWRDFDRGLLNDEEKHELAENYVHNYAQDLREGDLHATEVIVDNIEDPHIGGKLRHQLVESDIHLSLLHFLNQSKKPTSSSVRKRLVGDESVDFPAYWAGILQLLVQDGCSDDDLLALAKRMKPFVMAMIDDKREFFCSNLVWHLCLQSFMEVVRGILKSKEAFLVVISYEGFLPFIARTSCWHKSREDIMAERRLLRRSGYERLQISCCHQAHRVLCLALFTHRNALEETEMKGALDQIACSPLLSNDPECKDSTIVGLIRMMNDTEVQDRELLLECIIEPLLLTHNYVDARVIAALIEYGRGNESMEAAETVLNIMVSILGRNDDWDIQEIDSRYAAAVRQGLLEFGIDALISYGDEGDCEIADGIRFIAYGLCVMAMHSKTSRALRGRKSEIMLALDLLRKESAPYSDTICTLINALDRSAPAATCCNCLKEFDRKKLLYCQRCKVKCYCSPDCQAESFALGHDKFCKEEVQFVDSMREGGLSESELKRLEVLSVNLMMNGCKYIRSNMAEILDSLGEERQQGKEVSINFGESPPDVEVSSNDAGECSGSLKCYFSSPIYYGFIERVDWGVSEDICQETTISMRHFAQLCSPVNTAGQQK